MTVFVEVIGRGPNLTMLHGWGLNGAVWRNIRDKLAARFTLHIVDLPGHGHSCRADAASIATMTIAIARVLPKRSYLLGWSLGGLVALSLARRHAERFEKLVLIATTPSFLQRELWPHAVLPAVLDDFGSRLSNDYTATIKRFLALQVLGSPHIHHTVNHLQQAILAHGKPNVAALATTLEILRATDLRDEVRHIAQPTLVLQGQQDALTPEPAARWLAGQMPNARYALIPRAAHAPFLSHRDAFLRELEPFLSQ